MYDKNQSVKPSDINPQVFKDLDAIPFTLKSQKRVLGGEEYIQFIEDLFSSQTLSQYDFEKYDFKIYDDIQKMISDIKRKDQELRLCRLVAGYAWTWKTKTGSDSFDIEIDNNKIYVCVPLKNSDYKYQIAFTDYFTASEYVEMRFKDFISIGVK